MAVTSLKCSSRYWFRFMVGSALLACFGTVSGCKQNSAQAPIISSTGPDPASANLADPHASAAGPYGNSPSTLYAPAPGSVAPGSAPSAQRVRVLGASAAYQPQQSGESYSQNYANGQQTPAPIVRGNNSQQNESLQYNTQPPLPPNAQAPVPQGAQDPGPYAQDPNAGQDASYDPAYADAQENAGYEALEQADQAPPPLPEYEQPEAPADNYLWTPGYWGYTTGYYWVPGAWVAPPFYGALWTPPWWGSYHSRYFFHRGYWGPHVGYYGGIDYGQGYIGSGYYGGFWQGRNFYYNRSVTRVNINVVHNVYERPVVVNNITYRGNIVNRTAFNGPNGVRVQPRPYEVAALRETHYAPVPAQVQLRQAAASNRAQFFAENHGRPVQTFAQRPLSTPAAIASAPPPARNQPGFNQPGAARGGNPAFHGGDPGRGVGQPGFSRNGVVPGNGEPNGQLNNGQGNTIQQNRALEEERQRGLAVQQRLGQPATSGTAPRPNPTFPQDQRQGFDPQRNLQLQQQRDNGQERNNAQQLQQQRDAAQRNQQLRDAVGQQQRNQQFQQQRDAAAQQQRDAADQQQRNQQLQQQRDTTAQQQRDAAGQQQRNQQFQQQRDAAAQQQRDAAGQQQSNQQFQQQRDAAAQQQRDAAAQQQRDAAGQQQRNQQFQQQRDAAVQQQRGQQQQIQQQQQEQQRNAMRRNTEVQQRVQAPAPAQAPQRIEARPPAPSPQPHVEAPRPQAAAPHPGRP